MAEFDWSALQKEAEDTVLAEGDYVAQVTKAEATTSSTQKPMIKIQFTIVEGPKRDRKVFTQFVLAADSPFALKRWFQNLAALGLDASYFGRNPSLAQIAQDLMNRGAVITVGIRQWQGNDTNEVKLIKQYVPTGPVPPGMVLAAPSGPTSTSAVPSLAALPTPPVPSGPGSSLPAPPAPPGSKPF